MDIMVFTDGSFRKSPKYKRGFAGYGIYYPNKEIQDTSEPFLIKPITNPRAELYAIYIALKQITELIKDVKIIRLYTDSEYSANIMNNWIFTWANNGWKKVSGKPVKNTDILKKLYNYALKYKSRLSVVHVRAHKKDKDELSIGNDKADKLAKKGANKGKAIYETFI